MASDQVTRFDVIQSQQREQILSALHRLPACQDPLFRELALQRTSAVLSELKSLAAAEIVFQNTETWRAAYEKLLADLNFSTYLSVAWVRTTGYWRDQAGKHSIRLNYELLDKGLVIERILILHEHLWAESEASPRPEVRTWIEEQHYRGVSLHLVRQRDLKAEPDLIRDFGIYGERATGEQELDEEARTIRFRLSFADADIRLAKERWDRLKVFSVPCQQAIDL